MQAVVAHFVTGLARDVKDAMAYVAELVVALLVVCDNLGNSLNQPGYLLRRYPV